jgi:hypothetical protein
MSFAVSKKIKNLSPALVQLSTTDLDCGILQAPLARVIHASAPIDISGALCVEGCVLFKTGFVSWSRLGNSKHIAVEPWKWFRGLLHVLGRYSTQLWLTHSASRDGTWLESESMTWRGGVWVGVQSVKQWVASEAPIRLVSLNAYIQYLYMHSHIIQNLKINSNF